MDSFWPSKSAGDGSVRRTPFHDHGIAGKEWWSPSVTTTTGQNTMIRSGLRALRSTKAVSAAEYAILAVGIVVVVGGAVTAFRTPLANAFTEIGTRVTGVQTAQQ